MPRPKDNAVPPGEFARLRAHLQAKGVPAARLDGALGAAAGGRSRRQVADLVRAWLRDRPKG